MDSEDRLDVHVSAVTAFVGFLWIKKAKSRLGERIVLRSTCVL